MTELDPVAAQQFAEAMQRSAAQIEAAAAGMDKLVDKLGSAGREGAKKFSEEWFKTLSPAEQDRAMNELVDVSKSAWREFFDFMDQGWANTFGKIHRGIQRDIQQGLNSIKPQSTVGGFDGLAALKSSALAEVPFGGLLGIMLYGRFKEAEFAAKGQAIAQQFKTVGEVGRGVVREMSSDVRALEVGFKGTAQDLVAVASAFAQGGFDAEEAMQRASFATDGVQRSLVTTSLALDKLFQVGSGTTAQMAATLAIQVNGDLKESLGIVKDIGFAARETGMSFQTMLGSVLESTSAIRLQLNEMEELEDVANAIMRAQQGFRAEGMTGQRAAAFATAGMSGVASSIAALPQGLKAVLGERITGGAASGLAAIHQFERGFRGMEGERFFAETLQEIMGLVREIAPSDESTQYHVLKELFGMSPEAAQATLAMQRDVDSGLTLQAASERHAAELNRAFKDEALKTSTFTAMLKQLQDAVAQIGSGLMTILVTGFSSIEAVLKLGIGMMHAGSTGERGEVFNAFANRQLRLANIQGAAFDEIGRGMGRIGATGLSFGDVVSRGEFGRRDELDRIITRQMGGGIDIDPSTANLNRRPQRFKQVRVPAEQLTEGSVIEVRVRQGAVVER